MSNTQYKFVQAKEYAYVFDIYEYKRNFWFGPRWVYVACCGHSEVSAWLDARVTLKKQIEKQTDVYVVEAGGWHKKLSQSS